MKRFSLLRRACAVLLFAAVCLFAVGCEKTDTDGGQTDQTDAGVPVEDPVLKVDDDLVAFTTVTSTTGDSDAITIEDSETHIRYTRAPMCYEPVTLATGYGQWDDLILYRIENGDESQYLSLKYTGMGDLFCTEDALLPDPTSTTFDKALICRQDAVTIAEGEITDGALLAELIDRFLHSTPVTLQEDGQNNRRLKFTSAACPGIYYTLRYCEDSAGHAYLHDPSQNRTVEIGDLLDGYITS